MKLFTKMLLNTEMEQIGFISTYKIFLKTFSDGIFSNDETGQNFHKFQCILVVSGKENIPKQSHLSVFNSVSNLMRGLKYKAGTRLFTVGAVTTSKLRLRFMN